MTRSAPLALADGIAVAAPDEARLRATVARHHAFVWRSLRRLGVREDSVDDAAQQVWLVAARKLADVNESTERSFLFSVALRVAANARRSERRGAEVSCDDGEIEALDPSPDQVLENKRARAIADQILDTLPLDLRAAFVLFEIEDMTVPEVAAALEIPVGTAASRLRRAREAFQAKVARLRAKGVIA